jgi:subtilisin-like proprotein convertase family protein
VKYLMFIAIVFSFSNSVLADQAIVHKTGRYNENALRQSGMTIMEDYGSFVLVESPQGVQNSMLKNNNYDYNPVSDGTTICLCSHPFDTKVGPSENIPARLKIEDYPMGTKGLYLVQFKGPIKDKWLDDLKNSGDIEIVEYIPNNTYIVRMNPTDRDNVKTGLSTARWTGVFQPAYKLSSGLQKKGGGLVDVSFMVLANKGGRRLMKDILNQSVKQIQGMVSVKPYLSFKASVDASKLEEWALDPNMYWMEPWFEPKLFGEVGALNNAGVSTNGEVAGSQSYLSWLAGKGFPISTWNFVVNVTDTGLDKGNRAGSWHHDLYDTDGSTTRVAYATDWTGDAGSTNDGIDGDGHGTNCAGIIGGYNNATGTGNGEVSTTGYHFGIGVAPYVKLGSSKVFDYYGSWALTSSYTNLEQSAYTNGARLSSNSWGYDSGNNYNTDAREYDQLVRDASVATGNQGMCIFFAVSNDGPALNTTQPPGTAKNVISVAAAENWWPSYQACFWPSLMQNTPGDDIVYYSSRGPTIDGRIKPDLAGIANGVNTLKGQFSGSGCGDPYDTGDTSLYRNFNGTSSATPTVAGAAALMYQYWLTNYGVPPSPALIKAGLVATARDLVGGVDCNDFDGTGPALTNIPNNSQGWGLVNVGTLFDGSGTFFHDQQTTFASTGEAYNESLTINNNGKPVKVTLSFTDAPGNTAGNAWKNDLDLTVVSGGSTYKGNVFSGGYSTTGGTADGKNNLENVFLPAGTSGTIDITVTAANIVDDGVPGNADVTDQDFALFVYNASSSGIPVVDFSSAVYSGTENGGDITVTVNLNATSSNTVTVDYASSDGTAIAGSDYTAVNGTLTFNPNETSKTFTVTAIDDTMIENNETVTLVLSNASNATLGTARSPATLTIIDNDSLSVDFSNNIYSGAENGGSITVTVNLGGVSPNTFTVDYASSDGTATAGNDYTAVSGTLTFNPNEMSKTFTVTPINDIIAECSETVTLTLSNPSNAILGDIYQATLHMIDDDSNTICSSPNLPIPDNNTTGVTSSLVVSDSGNLSDLNVSVKVTHTWVGDLIFVLTHVDTGTSVTIIDQPGAAPDESVGCHGDDIDATLDDEVSSPVEDECSAGTPTISGTFKPNNPLSAFDYENLSGTWTLTVSDDLDGDIGILEYWSLHPTLTVSVWVDFNYSGTELGTESQPYNTLAEAINAVAVGGEIRINGGITSETFTGINKIDKKMTIKSVPGTGTVIIGKQ